MIRGRAAERPAGRTLELAIARAGAHYTKVDKAEIEKQHTPKTFGGTFIGQAPLDFKGWELDARGARVPVRIEAKETGSGRLDFSDKGLKEHQLEAIQDAVNRKPDADGRKIQVWLVVDMTTEGETYRVDGREVVNFAAAPWRSSLSIDWFRANGELCKVSDRGHPKRHSVWWLNTTLSPYRVVAVLAVAKDKALAEGRTVELYPAAKQMNQGASALDLRAMLASKPKHDASPAEQLAWRDRFSKWQLDRDHREAKRLAGRAKTFGRRGRG